jgi:hypothetical protein
MTVGRSYLMGHLGERQILSHEDTDTEHILSENTFYTYR